MSDEKKEARKVMKGTREFEHHLFKLLPATMQKNVSYKWKLPQLVPMEHAHIYHSIDDTNFQENEFSAPVGGHFHKVTYDFSRTDPRTGGPVITCGPALHRTTKVIPGIGPVSKVTPVRFERHEEIGGGDVVDSHTHQVEYIDTEILTAQGRQVMRQREREKVAHSVEPGTVSAQPAAIARQAESADKAKKFVKESPDVSGTT